MCLSICLGERETCGQPLTNEAFSTLRAPLTVTYGVLDLHALEALHTVRAVQTRPASIVLPCISEVQSGKAKQNDFADFRSGLSTNTR